MTITAIHIITAVVAKSYIVGQAVARIDALSVYIDGNPYDYYGVYDINDNLIAKISALCPLEIEYHTFHEK